MKAGVQSPLTEVGGALCGLVYIGKARPPSQLFTVPRNCLTLGGGGGGGQFLQSQQDPQCQSIKVQKIKRGQFTYVMSLKLHKTPRRDVFFYFDYYYLHFTTNFILLLIMTIIQQLL